MESNKIIDVLTVLIGEVDAVGESNADERRLANLYTLFDVTDWCLSGIEYAMESGEGRPEASMEKISRVAKRELEAYKRWLKDLLGD